MSIESVICTARSPRPDAASTAANLREGLRLDHFIPDSVRRFLAFREYWKSFLTKLSIPVTEEILEVGRLTDRYLSVAYPSARLRGTACGDLSRDA